MPTHILFPYKSRLIDYMKPVQVYRNLHAPADGPGRYSVRQSGRIVAHTDYLTLEYATFHVSPAGRARVLREKRKNVHAYIAGLIQEDFLNRIEPNSRGCWRVRYNPYTTPCFLAQDPSTGDTTPIGAARIVYFLPGAVYTLGTVHLASTVSYA